MKILLSYSKQHFDPDKPQAEHKFWGSSANILARSLHEELSKLGTLTYVDAATENVSIVEAQQFDLFVGIYIRFQAWLRASQAKQSIFFAVNMHPRTRNQLLNDFRRHQDLPAAALSQWELADGSMIEAGLAAADHIICVGNLAVYNSYITHGIPKRKLKMINYAVGPASTKPTTSQSKPRFLYIASEVGLRKGFDILAAMVENAATRKTDFELSIIGAPSTDYYQTKLKELCDNVGAKVTNHGWVPSGTKEYDDLVRKHDYVIGPSLEEGQAGALLDAMRHGVVPLLSSHTGIDFSPLGWLELKTDSAANIAVLNTALELSQKERMRLKSKTLEYYRLYHEPYRQNLISTLEGALTGQLYPKISVVLAIFNKAQTIKDLLQHFDQAALEYGHVELHVIFDGCKDATQQIVRDYYHRRQSYPITYEVTPNIFEVKSNNLGLRKSTGKYCAILQDDNMIDDRNIFFESVTFLDKNPQAAILGGLAGVNYYPRGTIGLSGAGQIAMNENEVYWRQDAVTDPSYNDKIFEVDACMRGPLFLRKSFLEQYGYLDDVYAPLYQDDMDIAFRAKKHGFQVFCILLDVRNESLTIAHYNPERTKFFEDIMKRNTDIFYKRWAPTTDKDYSSVNRIRIETLPHERRQARRQQIRHAIRRQTLRPVKTVGRRAKRYLKGIK